jgi:peptide/nickel transport system ATP-binding protein
MSEEIIRAVNLKKWFPLKLGFFKTLISKTPLFVKAVDGVSFNIKKGEIFGLAGESGSGKTTTGRLLLRLIEPTYGQIFFKGKEITRLSVNEQLPLRREMQIIFQDPYESLNPRMTVSDIISEPLRVLGISSNEKEIEDLIYKVLRDVKLTPPDEFLFRYPHELSGGQRQRVAIARAFVTNPSFIVADEPVSMLDVSIRAEILNIMLDLARRNNVSFLYITHDLALARHMCDRIAIMYLGKIVELGETEKIIFEPLHPYTKALLEAVPIPDPDVKRGEVVIKGEIPSPINPPKGCRFHTRCPSYLGDICATKRPRLIDVGNRHYVACHLYSSSR